MAGRLCGRVAASVAGAIAVSAGAAAYPEKAVRVVVPFPPGGLDASSEQGSLRDANVRESAAAAVLIVQASNSSPRYPDRPIRLVVPFPPGGGTDVVARSVALKLGALWNQSVIVDNRPGAAAIVGTEIVARAVPDGYTLAVVSMTHTINVSLYRKLPYDPVADFVPLILAATAPNVLVVTPVGGREDRRRTRADREGAPGAAEFSVVGQRWRIASRRRDVSLCGRH